MSRTRFPLSLAGFVALVGLLGCTVITNPNRQPASPSNVPSEPATAPQPAPTATPAAPQSTGTPAPPPQRRAPPAATPQRRVPAKVSVRIGGREGNGRQPRTPPALPALRLRMMTAPNPFGTGEQTPGALVARLYELPAGAVALPALDRMAPTGFFYAKQLDVQAQRFTQGFPGLSDRAAFFAIRYSGTFQVTNTGPYEFRVISDDGARVYVDNALLIDNDGVHRAQAKTQTIRLAPGAHHLQVDYFQASGNVALQLFVSGPDGRERLWTSSL